MKAGILSEPVLVGRERELEELQRCLDSAIEGKGRTVFVSGEAGAGKTRLINEFLSKVSKKGIILLSGWCLSDAAVPYLPFAEAFRAHFSADEEESIADQAVEDLRSPAKLGSAGIEGYGITAWLSGPSRPAKPGGAAFTSPQAWKDQLFTAVAQTLHSMSIEQPVILLIEDAHWADSASLALLHYVARATRSERILVLATFRSEELTAGAEGRPNQLTETIRLMRREDLLTEIKLPNLDEADVGRLAENMIGGSLQVEFAQKLVLESQGNPLFVVESLRMLSERKSLIKAGEEWRLTADTLGIPSKVKDIILQRLSMLKFDQRKILDAASVIGEEFDVGLLSAVLGTDSLDILQTLSMIAHSTSLVYAERDCYRFDHAKSREILYEELSAPLKRGYHERIAEKLEKAGGSGRLPYSDLAYHYAHAENMEKAVKHSFAAGQDALARFSNGEAIKHFAYVLQTVPDTQENAETRRIALEGLGDAYYANGIFGKALEVFERLGESEAGAIKLRAYRKAMDAIFFGTLEWGRFLELVKKAEPFAASDRLEGARIRFLRGGAMSGLKKYEASLEDFEGALQVFEEEYSLPDVARALTALGVARVLTGNIPKLLNQCERALSSSLRSIALHEELGDFRWLIDATFHGGITFALYNLRQEAEVMLNRTVQVGEKIGDYTKLRDANVYLSYLLRQAGCIEKALSKMLKVLEYSEKTDARIDQDALYANLAKLYSEIGDFEHAQMYYSKIQGLLSGTKPISDFSSTAVEIGFLSGYETAVVRAVFLAVNNRWSEAYQQFDKALEIANTTLSVAVVSVKTDYAWALERQGRTEEASVLRLEAQRAIEEQANRFAHANVHASLMARARISVGQEFEVRLDLVNISRKPGLLLKAEELFPPAFRVTVAPLDCILRNGSVEFDKRSIGAFQVVTVKLRLKPLKAGSFALCPVVTYVDDLGEPRTCKPEPVVIVVQQAKPVYEVLPNRVSTGYEELDALLFGGIPEKYAVILASPSTDEREQLIGRFLEAGITAGGTTFHIATEAADIKTLAVEYASNFYLITCNPQADTMVQSAPNVFKLKGVENLTDIDIALTKAFRGLDPSTIASRRICIEIVSDVLLQHHAVTTRRWLSSLLPTLKSKGFTVLATVNPRMHPPEEYEAIIGLFDGEISVYEKEAPEGGARFLRIKRMTGQKYLKDEVPLTEE